MAKSGREKLGILLRHWIEHNEAHGCEFQEWGNKAAALGESAVRGEILEAVQRLQQANEHLRRAWEA